MGKCNRSGFFEVDKQFALVYEEFVLSVKYVSHFIPRISGGDDEKATNILKNLHFIGALLGEGGRVNIEKYRTKDAPLRKAIVLSGCPSVCL